MTDREIRGLTETELCAAIGRLQWSLALETARDAYHRPAGEGRAARLAELRGSASVIDRYAGQLVDRWDRERQEQQKGARV